MKDLEMKRAEKWLALIQQSKLNVSATKNVA